MKLRHMQVLCARATPVEQCCTSKMSLSCSRNERQANLVDLGKVVSQHLLHAALLLRLLLQRLQALQKQVILGVGGLELEWERPMRGEDTQEHLSPLLHLLDAPEALIHPSTHPSRNLFALLLVAPALGGDALDLLLGDPLHPPLQRHERSAC